MRTSKWKEAGMLRGQSLSSVRMTSAAIHLMVTERFVAVKSDTTGIAEMHHHGAISRSVTIKVARQQR